MSSLLDREVRLGTVILVVLLALLLLPVAVQANHLFADVPTAEFYHGPVEQLFNARITVGCGAGIYCPNQATTRGEMSTFLSRGLGRVAYSQGTPQNLTGQSEALPQVITQVQLTVGGAESGGQAFVKLDASWTADFNLGACGDTCPVHLQIRQVGGPSSATSTDSVDDSDAHSSSGSLTWVVPVDTASAPVFQLVAWSNDSDQVTVRGDISALYVPFGG